MARVVKVKPYDQPSLGTRKPERALDIDWIERTTSAKDDDVRYHVVSVKGEAGNLLLDDADFKKITRTLNPPLIAHGTAWMAAIALLMIAAIAVAIFIYS